MSARPLTPAEKALSRSVFGDAIDLAAVLVRHRRWWPFQPRNAVMAPDGDIWCHPRGGLYRDCYAAASLQMQALFVHEMVHVWQAQTRGRWYLPLMRHPFCTYAYRLAPGRPFARYGIEQQAEIVADAFLLMRGVTRIGGPRLADYRAILPFSPFAAAESE
ncbi:vgr related protein [Rhizorhabdus dicambivorans]|uniref:Vgr related protein n=1 Tax=Rhizorhabdus dicambivorans TaxID=1850238 RepID=A0A2A4FUJ4_9SPHN|nr:vgr related protein [Rhizorhabdus dicambivorans]ATE63570.1 vgr related protein [Rhizorhabdus dicambivorans]PCE41374.1 vgr related protein [Rhizorhabdus dicambivorans]